MTPANPTPPTAHAEKIDGLRQMAAWLECHPRELPVHQGSPCFLYHQARDVPQFVAAAVTLGFPLLAKVRLDTGLGLVLIQRDFGGRVGYSIQIERRALAGSDDPVAQQILQAAMAATHPVAA